CRRSSAWTVRSPTATTSTAMATKPTGTMPRHRMRWTWRRSPTPDDMRTARHLPRRSVARPRCAPLRGGLPAAGASTLPAPSGDDAMKGIGRSTGLRRLAAAAMLLAILVAGCDRKEGGQLPAPGGEAIVGERATVEGFGLVRAWPDEADGS